MGEPLTFAPASDQDTFSAIIEGAPAMLWLGDTHGRCIFLNRELRAFWGVTGDCLHAFDWSTTLHPEDSAKLGVPYTRAMEARSPFEVEARFRRADGIYRLMRCTGRPRLSPHGTFLGMVGVNVDVTDQRAAETALRRSGEQLKLALDAASSLGTWVWDIPAGLVRADPAFAQTFGIDPAAAAAGVPVQHIMKAVVPEDRAALRGATRAAMRAGASCQCDFRVRRGEGPPRWLQASGRCEHDAEARPLRFAGVAMDIGDRKAREEDLSLLTRELSHRIKNIFTVVQAMTSMAGREDPAAAPVLTKLADRFSAMAAAYTVLTPADGEVLPSGCSLHPLLERLFAPYACDARARITVEGPDLPLDQRSAASLALIMHELATNAAKYGALSACGSVTLRVALDQGDVVFDWDERGGPAVTRPTAEGFGSRLIRSSAAALGATIAADWAPEGLRWRLTMPVARLRRD